MEAALAGLRVRHVGHRGLGAGTVLYCNVWTVSPRSRYFTVLYYLYCTTSEQVTSSSTDTTSTELPCSPPARVPPATTSTGNSHLRGEY